MILETVCVGALEVNCYILASDNGAEAIIIDPGSEENKIRKVLNKHKLNRHLLLIPTAISTISVVTMNLACRFMCTGMK